VEAPVDAGPSDRRRPRRARHAGGPGAVCVAPAAMPGGLGFANSGRF